MDKEEKKIIFEENALDVKSDYNFQEILNRLNEMICNYIDTLNKEELIKKSKDNHTKEYLYIEAKRRFEILKQIHTRKKNFSKDKDEWENKEFSDSYEESCNHKLEILSNIKSQLLNDIYIMFGNLSTDETESIIQYLNSKILNLKLRNEELLEKVKKIWEQSGRTYSYMNIVGKDERDYLRLKLMLDSDNNISYSITQDIEYKIVY